MIARAIGQQGSASDTVRLDERGYSVNVVQNARRHRNDPGLLRHSDVSTTMICTPVLNRGGRGVRSPLDAIV